MKINIYNVILVNLLLAFFNPCNGQEVWHQGISQTNVNVRGNPIVVGQITINISTPGRVIVNFDGECYADVGDLIVLAASNSPDWTPNDGNVGIEVANSDVNHSSFSHTRVYDQSPGSHNFYAVAQNVVEQGGSGIVSIYASLTVKFFPDSINYIFAEHQGIVETDINVRGNPVTVGHFTINAPRNGRAVVHFDGDCYADVGDRIVLAASDSPNWIPDDGNVGIEVANNDVNHSTFSHTRVYDIFSGNDDFYAVAHNWVEEEGNGIASIYGNLTVEFFPVLLDSVNVKHQGIAETDINVRGTPVTVGHISINVTTPGKAIVHFDGDCFADVGDLIVLAASDSPNWSPNDGNVSVEVVDNDVNHHSFSHTRVYDVSAGFHDFYAVVQNSVEQDGNGIVDIYASLTVEFFPGVVNDVQYSNDIPVNYLLSQNYPNPFNPNTKIQYAVSSRQFVSLKIYDILGKEIETLVNEEKPTGTYEIIWNAESLPSGVYFYQLRAVDPSTGSGQVFVETKNMILLK